MIIKNTQELSLVVPPYSYANRNNWQLLDFKLKLYQILAKHIQELCGERSSRSPALKLNFHSLPHMHMHTYSTEIQPPPRTIQCTPLVAIAI